MADYQAYVPDYDLIKHIVTERCEADMLVTVGISRYFAPYFDEDTGVLDSGSVTKLWTGIARIATLSGPLTFDYGEEQSYWQQAQAYIPLLVNPIPQVNDRLDVMAAKTPGLVGRTYRITDVQRGGEWPGAITLTLIGAQPQPTAQGDEIRSEWWAPSL